MDIEKAMKNIEGVLNKSNDATAVGGGTLISLILQGKSALTPSPRPREGLLRREA